MHSIITKKDTVFLFLFFSPVKTCECTSICTDTAVYLFLYLIHRSLRPFSQIRLCVCLVAWLLSHAPIKRFRKSFILFCLLYFSFFFLASIIDNCKRSTLLLLWRHTFASFSVVLQARRSWNIIDRFNIY